MTKMQSSGEERVFESGAIRDGGKKPMLQLISPHAHMRLGEWLRFACQDRQPKPYPPRNWEQGLPFSDTVGAMERHIQKFKMGLRDEDHIAAIMFGSMVIAHCEHEIAEGRMDPEIDDMPHYEDRARPWPRQKVYPEVSPGPPVTEPTRVELSSEDREFLGELRKMHDTLHFEAPDRVMLQIAKAAGIHTSKDLITDNRKTFYICGPMRGLPFLNFPAFDGARNLGQSLGHKIISPADMDRQYGLDPVKDPASPERVHQEFPDLSHELAARDVAVILDLVKDRGDGLALLPGWEHSVGGMAEVRLAYWLDLCFVDACTWEPIDVAREWKDR